MSTETDNYALPIPDNRPESEQSGYAALLAVRNALIAIDALLKGHAEGIAGKAGTDATWGMSRIDGLADALAGKMPAAATFALGDLSDTAGVADALVGYVLARMPDGKWSPASAQAVMGAHEHLMGDVLGLASALAAKLDVVSGVPNSRTISAGTGLTGGGNLGANRTLAVSYGTGAGTSAEGNDSRIVNAVQEGDARLTNSREWTASTVSQNEAEAGTSNTRRAWTATRIKQAVIAHAPTPPVGLYTGSTRDETDFPIGHYVAISGGSQIARNAVATPHVPNNPGTAIDGYAGVASGNAVPLSGVWRMRGNPMGAAGVGVLAQRVA